MKLSRSLTTCATALALSSPLFAAAQAVDCGDSIATTGNSSYLACLGPIDGNNLGANGIGDSPTLDFGSGAIQYTLVDDNISASSTTLSFDSSITGLFVVAIKGGPDYSLYQFDGGVTGVTSLAYDTLGIANGNGSAGPGLSHASLYTTAPIPEPETYALMLAGIAGIGFVARRRKAAQT